MKNFGNTMHIHHRTRLNLGPTGGDRPVLRDMEPSESQNITRALISAQAAHTVGPHAPPYVTHTMILAHEKRHLATPNMCQIDRNHLDAHAHWFLHI
jgi:hypothetical protein